RAPYVMGKADSAFSRGQKIEDTTIGWRFVNPLMKKQYGIDSMPETAENVAEQFNISREDQDLFALRSQEKTAKAQAAGIFAEEIVAIEIPRRKQEPLIFDTDEHPRASTLEKLAALPAPFRENGSVTAGNASGVNDGAAAMLVASADAVQKHGLKPVARILGMATAGVEPRIMGIGPVPAVRELLDKQGLTIDQIDVIELNEAFRSGSVTAGNASGVNDGAAAMLVASADAVQKHGLKPVARILGMATAGVEPRIMGIGPVPAVRKLLDKQGLTIDQIDVIELNEAFAAQGLAVMRELGVKDDDARVNPNGGAIALGHPLGMSGARLLMTAALQ